MGQVEGKTTPASLAWDISRTPAWNRCCRGWGACSARRVPGCERSPLARGPGSVPSSSSASSASSDPRPDGPRRLAARRGGGLIAAWRQRREDADSGRRRCGDLQLQCTVESQSPAHPLYWHSPLPPGRKLKLWDAGEIPWAQGAGVGGLGEEMGSESWAGGWLGGVACTPCVERVVIWPRVDGAAGEGRSSGDFSFGASQGWRRPASGEHSPLGGAPHPHLKRRTGTKVAGGLALEKIYHRP